MLMVLYRKDFTWNALHKGVLCTNPRTGALGMSPAPVTMSVML